MRPLPRASSQGATDILRRDHDVIEDVISVLEAVVSRLLAEPNFPRAPVREDLRMLEAFADGLHGFRLEQILLPAVDERGSPALRRAFAAAAEQHHSGRELLSELRAAADAWFAGDEARVPALVQAAEQYIDHTRAQLAHERCVVLPLMDSEFGDQRWLAERLGRGCQHGPCRSQHSVVDDLRSLRSSVPPPAPDDD